VCEGKARYFNIRTLEEIITIGQARTY